MNGIRRAAMAAVIVALLVAPAMAQRKAEPSCVGGTADSPAVIEVFSDFQCPACRQFYLQTVRQVLADFSSKNQVCVVYHEYPLPMHTHARTAARFAAAAKRIGNEQWIRVADALFVAQATWSTTGDVEGAVKGALSAEDFARVQEIAKDPGIVAEIERDISEGRNRGVQSTPTIWVTVNGNPQKVVGSISYTTLRNYLVQQLGTQ